MGSGGPRIFEIAIKDGRRSAARGRHPSVSIFKDGGYCTLEWGDDPELEVDLMAAIEHKLRSASSPVSSSRARCRAATDLAGAAKTHRRAPSFPACRSSVSGAAATRALPSRIRFSSAARI